MEDQRSQENLWMDVQSLKKSSSLKTRHKNQALYPGRHNIYNSLELLFKAINTSV